jgi:hypothetical protein
MVFGNLNMYQCAEIANRMGHSTNPPTPVPKEFTGQISDQECYNLDIYAQVNKEFKNYLAKS